MNRYIKALTRIFIRKKQLSYINLLGLSVGMAAFLLIFIHVHDELSFDRHHENSDNIYRLLLKNPNTGAYMSILPGAAFSFFEDKVPGVERIARLDFHRETYINPGDHAFAESGFIAADPQIFDILTFSFIKGDPATALNSPHSIILTPQAVEKYFADEDPIGKTMVYNNFFNFTVTAVVEPFPVQSHINFSMIASIDCIKFINPTALTNWENFSHYYYLKVEPDADLRQIENTLELLLWDGNEQFREFLYLSLQPLHKTRLYSKGIDWDIALRGDILQVWLFSAIAALILLMACFNFINLSTAGASSRGKEVGVKKVLGATHSKLIRHFLGETLIFSLLSLICALMLAELAIPLLNTITGKTLSLKVLSEPKILISIPVLLIVISVIAGGYPAMVLSRFIPVQVLKGSGRITSLRGLKNKRYQLRLRQLLLVLQFGISIILIICSLTFFKQTSFLYSSCPGYDKSGLLVVKNPWDDNSSSRAMGIRDQLFLHPEVQMISLSHNTPPVDPSNYSRFSFKSSESKKDFQGAIISCDEQFFRTLGARIVKGRDFYDNPGADIQGSAVINRAAAAVMQLDDPIGVVLSGFYDQIPRAIIGVVDDIQFNSVHKPVAPMVFFISHDQYPHNFFNLVIRFSKGSEKPVLEQINHLWKDEASIWPLQYFFIDNEIKNMYAGEHRQMLMITSFTGLAIFLSFLGLIGLTLFSASSRQKEIGIRKVMGASTGSIVKLLIGEYSVLVLISNIIAWPVAWYAVNRWLENFVHRIDISLWVFVIAALLVYLTAVLIVGVLSFRVANLNPCATLNSE